MTPGARDDRMRLVNISWSESYRRARVAPPIRGTEFQPHIAATSESVGRAARCAFRSGVMPIEAGPSKVEATTSGSRITSSHPTLRVVPAIRDIELEILERGLVECGGRSSGSPSAPSRRGASSGPASPGAGLTLGLPVSRMNSPRLAATELDVSACSMGANGRRRTG